jgi:hypothetical protein
VDGSVVDDPAWAHAVPLTEFWQTTPEEGRPASERTEVRVLYTSEALYFGVVCHDREPDKIIVAESRRDSPLDDSDSFQIILDTYRDGQNGFVFGTNPAGIEYDGQVAREGQEGDRQARQQSGAGGGFNLNWDAAWTVRTKTGDFGWSAEFEIPFRTLRYPRRDEQVWGLNLQRNIRRHKETAYWSALPRQYNLFRVSQAGTLKGLKVRSQRNLKLSPFLLGEGVRRYAAGVRTDWDGEAGFDLKYSLTPGLTLDGTVNTDFAQVEVDEQQVNLDRFNLFFPEKRPFFLENAGQFAVGSGGEAELFFSRRIGIGSGGEVVPILAGGRVSGKTLGTSVGLLSMQTRSVSGVARANNFGVVRLNRDLPNRSAVGLIFVNRQGTGEGPERDTNRTLGLDGRWGVGRYSVLSGYVARTKTPGIEAGDHAFLASLENSLPGWDLNVKYSEVGEGFNPEAGFLRRKGYRKPDVLVLHRRRMNGWLGLHEWRPHVSYRGFYKPDGFWESGFLHLDQHFEFRGGHEVDTGLNFTREGLRAPFEIFPGVVVPPGEYDHKEAQIVAFTNQGAAVSLNNRLVVGGFFGGHRLSLQPTLKARIGEALNASVSGEYNDVDLPWGEFKTTLGRMRLSYSFTPRLFVQALLQYNDRVDLWSSNVRVGWLQTANTGLFVVYNETRDTVDGLGGAIRDRSLVVKFSRLLDLLN